MPKGNVSSVSELSMPPIDDSEANQLVKVQRDILNIVVTSDDFQLALDSLCLAAEGIVENALASIMLFEDSSESLRVRSGPSLSSEALELFNGLKPAEDAGSCGTAVFTGKPQFVTDTSSDERWKNHLKLVRELDVHACWSMPIQTKDGRFVGSFALASFEKRVPSDFQINLLQTTAYLAGIIVQREIEYAQLQQAAHYDHLTKLPNRFLFNLQAEQAIARANRTKDLLSIFFIDLDNFKNLNDQLGHDAGDEVLRRVSKRMSSNIRREDSLARIGGDEFVLLVESAKTHRELMIIAEKLVQTLAPPFCVQGQNWKIGASIGISSFPKDGLTLEKLIRNADKAMYTAKSSSSCKIKFYSS